MSALSTELKPGAPQVPTVGLLLSVGALTALWVGINLLYPELYPSGIPAAVTRLAIHLVILAGLWLALSRTDFSYGKRVLIWLTVAVPFTLWFALVWNLALDGVFKPLPTGLPILPIAIFAPVMIGLFILLRSKLVGTLLDATPAHWLIALQVYRILGSIFIVNWVHGTASAFFAWPAGLGDASTGIMALPVALLLASGAETGHRAAMAWNVFGLLDFAVAITTATLSLPGPLQVFGFDITAPSLGIYPTVMTPAFAVPTSILLHALSIRQLRRLRRSASSPASDRG